jgi:hypothetical protein
MLPCSEEHATSAPEATGGGWQALQAARLRKAGAKILSAAAACKLLVASIQLCCMQILP